MFDKSWIAQHLPHQGAMCLLEEVVDCQENFIICRATSHRNRNNPLLVAGSLGIACGVEYAAQAMALHAAWVEAEGKKSLGALGGVLARIKDTTFYRPYLHDVAGDITVTAVSLFKSKGGLIYDYRVQDEALVLLCGRATIVLS